MNNDIDTVAIIVRGSLHRPLQKAFAQITWSHRVRHLNTMIKAAGTLTTGTDPENSLDMTTGTNQLHLAIGSHNLIHLPFNIHIATGCNTLSSRGIGPCSTTLVLINVHKLLSHGRPKALSNVTTRQSGQLIWRHRLHRGRQTTKKVRVIPTGRGVAHEALTNGNGDSQE